MTNKTKWSIDKAHCEVGFRVRHLMIAHVNGTFKIFDANIYTTNKDFTTAEIDFWIDSSSLNTGDEIRDAHLKSADFFDVTNHKQISFISSSIGEEDEDGEHELWGELSIRGITKRVKLYILFGGTTNDPWGNEKAGFCVNGIIKRSDWGLVWNKSMDTGGLMVSDEIHISCEIELANAGPYGLTMKLDKTIKENILY